MVATRSRPLHIDADVLDLAESRATATGVPVDELVSEILRQGLDDREPTRETRNGVRMLRRSRTGKKVTPEDVMRLWDELN